MNFIKLFEEFTETSKNTPLLYKDDNLEVKVATTFDSVKQQNKDTNWCSTNPGGFYAHNKTANMYRFNFSDGYKLRLTWDYITQRASHLGSYSGGTHWGQGGIVDGENQYYDVFRPEGPQGKFEWLSTLDINKTLVSGRFLIISDPSMCNSLNPLYLLCVSVPKILINHFFKNNI
jgi:hypothetical protein